MPAKPLLRVIPGHTEENYPIPSNELQKSLSLLQATLESTADGILVVNKNGRIEAYNRRFVDMWGIPEAPLSERNDEMAIRSVTSLLKEPEAFLQRIQELYSRPREESHDILELKDGRIFQRYSRPQFLDGQVVGRVWSFHDITQERRALEESKGYQRRLQTISEISRSFVEARLCVDKILDSAAKLVAEYFQDGCTVRLLSNGTGKVTTPAFHHVNPRALERMKETLPQMNYFVDVATAQRIKEGKPVLIHLSHAEVRERLPPSLHGLLEEFPVHSWIAAPLHGAEEVSGAISVFRFAKPEPYSPDDLSFLMEIANRTALSLRNAQLFEEAQKAIELREDFMAIASHELKTPLTPLQLQLQLAHRILSSAPAQNIPVWQKLLHMIGSAQQQVERLARLVEDILDASRLRTGRLTLNLESVDLSLLVREVAARFRPQLLSAGCKLQIHLEPSIVGRWDRLRLEQLVNNLLSNAMKYGAGKPIHITLLKENHSAVLSVRDFGIGISKTDQAKLFQRFGRAVSDQSFGGLGMGLYIAQQIVEAHHGKIEIDSEEGKGSTFTATLPLSTHAAPP